MKQFLLCLIATVALNAHAATTNPQQPVQPFSAVLWKTTTLHSPSGGKESTFMQRTVYTRDSSGKVRSEIYQPTKGLQHDTTAPLERVLTVSTSPQALPNVQASGETLVEEADLGTRQFSGFPAKGNRQTFRDATGQHTRTFERWFCATLGLTVHMESHNYQGDTVFSELAELHVGEPASSSVEAVPEPSPAIPLLILYRSLFTLTAHMEWNRLANDPNRHVNMDEIEDHLRKKLGLSTSDWKVLVDKSIKVDNYTRETSERASDIAAKNRAARHESSLPTPTLAADQATLHTMHLDLNTHIQEDIDALKTAVGPDATTRLEAYLQGPLAASTHRMPSKSAQVKAQLARKEQEQ